MQLQQEEQSQQTQRQRVGRMPVAPAALEAGQREGTREGRQQREAVAVIAAVGMAAVEIGTRAVLRQQQRS